MRTTLSGRFSQLSPEKRVLLMQQLRKAAGGTGNTIVRRSQQGPVPLSFAQQRLWFLNEFEPGSPVYNLPAAMRLTGRLQVDLLERTLTEIARRHESLRTTFAVVDGQPAQIIAPPKSVKLSLIDLTALRDADAESRRLAALEARRPFDLGRGPLFRCVLLRIGYEQHIALLTIHHIVSDAWSTGVLIRELATLYQAYERGAESPLEELSFQYGDYAALQQAWLQGETFEKQLAYWREQLDGAPPVLELPTDRPRSAVESHRGATYRFVLDGQLLTAVKELGQREGATLFMTLLAAYKTLLSRYSGQDDVVVGTSIAGRERLEIEPLIGFFVNMLPLRTKLTSDPCFTELLARVKSTCLGAYAHQEMPFEKLVEELQPERSLSHAPLFQVMFVLQNTPHEEFQIPGLTFETFNSGAQTAKFDLTLLVNEAKGVLRLAIEYSTDLFDRATIERIAGHFETLLRNIVADPSRRVSELPLLTNSERRQLTVEWNDTARSYPNNQCLHELFEKQVTDKPNSIAVSCDDEQLTFAELNARANRLARYLRRFGVGPDVRVGILLERSVDLVVSFLGVLKAGGCYVPLDPAYPLERLAYMLADSAAGVVLTHSTLLDTLPSHSGQEVLLDLEVQEIAAESDENPDALSVSENLAYVLYTSGSTGNPKGVAVTHRNVARLIFAQTYAHFGPTEVFLLMAPVCFDASTFELWGALLHGARLAVMQTRVPSFDELGQTLRRHQVTTLWLTAGLFHQVVEHRVEELCGLRQILAGGDVVSPAHAARYMASCDGRLINGYGPTEATTFACCHTVEAWELKAGRVPIGRPIANTQVYILDKNLQPVPPGVAGELYIGGAGLARGYLNRPGLTAERFVPSPYSGEEGDRLYRTGDIVKYLHDGRIDFIGRRDGQVKIRGFRIEVGEIESVLLRYPQVVDVVVEPKGEGSQKRLVAYVVTRGDAVSSGELRTFLSERLPEHMWPSLFVSLEKLPLTENGKVDHRALPEPEVVRVAAEQYVGPRTEREEMLCAIWREVLGVERIGIDDNYFELGGDSIRSIQIVAKAQALGFDLNIQQIFRHQSIRELAQAMVATTPVVGPIEKTEPFTLVNKADRLRLPSDVEDAYPLTYLQAGMVFHSEYSSTMYHDIFSYHLRTHLDVDALRSAIQRLCARHPVLRTSLMLSGLSEPLQLVYRRVEAPLAIDDLRGLTEDEQKAIVDAWIEEEKSRKFDWEKPPLLRFQVHIFGAETFQLTLSFHHIILDGWSVASMNMELFQLYFAPEQNGQVEPFSVTSTFRDFVAAERRTLASTESRHFWARKLSDATISTLPRWDADAHTATSREIRILEIPISTAVSDGLKTLAQAASASIKSVLLAAHLRVMSWLSGRRDVLTGLVSNGRPETADGERVLGLFLNTLPFRFYLSGGTWLDLVRDTFVAELELLPYKLYPMPEIQRMQGGERLFETMFNFIHFHVYHGLRGFKELELVRGMAHQETSATLITHGKLDLEDGRVKINLEYDARQLNAEQISFIANYFTQTITAMATEPLKPYFHSQLLSTGEQAQLVQSSKTARETRDVCLGELFAEQVSRTPDAVALTFGDQKLTYAELNTRANQLAHFLKREGAGAESRVALLLERSLEMVISILGVLKAGACYVPLEPTYPRERLEWVLDDSGAEILLTQEALREKLDGCAVRVICLDGECASLDQESDEEMTVSISPDNLCYVIYTSGSTGRPKGVAVTHRNVARLFDATADSFRFSSSDVWTLFHSYAFDFSVWELWGALLHGGRLVVVPYWVSRTPEAFRRLLATERVTVLNQTPSAFRQLSHAEIYLYDSEPELSLRTVVFGGEALEPASLRPWMEKYGDAVPELVNMYGITETCVHVTERRMRAADVQGGAASLIGRALDDLRLYILDEEMQPVPLGVAGELYVGGAGLARGYLNRSGLTAERFVPDPFAVESGQRLYRTGDVGRLLATGEVEYLGRCDQQVKIRGHRIELGEIESALLHHPGVHESVVLARDAPAGGKQLVAYVVIAEELTSSDLRDQLKLKLPEHMIPSRFVTLAQLPLTPNGKIDRRALPAPEESYYDPAREYIVPRTPYEEVIAMVWQEVLRSDRVGACDNFFELGGHSLSATQVILRLRRVLGVELELRALFEAPTLRELATRIEIALHGEQDVSAPPIERAPRHEALPLSFAQERLWFLHQLDPADPSYHVPYGIRIEGSLNIGAFRKSLDEVVRRHEVLRTTFASNAGRRVQVISSPTNMPVPVVDLSLLRPGQQEEETRRLTAEEARVPFNLSLGPVLRCMLLRFAEQEHAALITMHHIASDAWSMSVLVKEVVILYEAFSEGRESPLDDLPIQYADYAAWQRNRLQGEFLEEQLSYWRKQLDGAPPLLELPTDKPRPAVRTHRGGHCHFALDHDLTRSLKQLSREEGATLYMTLLAGLNVLLTRYSRQRDIVVGASIAGRRLLEVEPLIGFFINTLALRTEITDDLTFRQLIGRLHETCLGAYAHQDLPFEKLVEELQPERSLSHTPLFQVMFVLQNAPHEDLILPDIRLSNLNAAPPSAKFDLTLTITEREEELAGSFEYNVDLFDGATIERLGRHFKTLLQGAVSNPDRKILNLPLLSAEERRQLLVSTSRDVPAHRQHFCLHELFEQQAQLSPDSVALTCEGEQLNYAELNARANQLAHFLRRQGVGTESRVTLLLERSTEMVISILGVLKAGGCYVPLDPTYPRERLEWMLEDAGAGILLTQEDLRAKLDGCAVRVICIDSESLAEESDAELATAISPDNLCYVIYTSGSTGKPKGVAITHRNVARLFDVTEDSFRFSSSDVWTLFHSYAFDFSVWELWGALLHGGRLVVVPYWVSRTPETFRRLLVTERVTVLSQTPSAFRQLSHAEMGLSHSEPELSLRTVVFGGEALEPASLRPWVERYGDAAPELVNMYGITETCVHVTQRRVRAEEVQGGAGSLIGGALDDLQLYILDEWMEPAPLGVAGELYVGGAGLARGYLNRAGLTAERFVPDPFGETGGARLYRTGDLGRRLASGEVEYLGRCDHQVKVRGFRIELGEIESILQEHMKVRDVAVVTREDSGGHQQLVAYVVAAESDDSERLLSELRAYVAARLPEHMAPSLFIKLDHLPLTRNGKLDRSALPAPETERRVEVEYVAPGNVVEEVLAFVWGSVLGLEQLGINDNFFELGGHSLLATQVVSQVEEIFAVDLPLRTLFESPTISGVSKVLIEKSEDLQVIEAIARTFIELQNLSEEEVRTRLLEREESHGGELCSQSKGA